ncbi:MAG: hypothetical protein D6743_04015 [Calditrichaeota bacterium]|nr:MAG: hypothetical protein D6743_04015 [Calditrichota bacterium]
MKRLCLAVLLLLFGGCERTVTRFSPPAPGGIEFFPLQVGNQWTYELQHDSTFQMVVRIVDSTRIGSHLYFAFEQNYAMSSLADTTFYRTEGDTRVFVNRGEGDKLYIDFGRPTGKSWPSENGVATIREKNGTRVVKAGEFTRTISIDFDPAPMAIDDEHSDTFAPEVGRIEMVGQIGRLQLVSAWVNGKAYPSKTR